MKYLKPMQQKYRSNIFIFFNKSSQPFKNHYILMEITEAELGIFFGKNKAYYLGVWDRYQSGENLPFKPYAFLFGIFWFIYRKMYFEGLVIFLVSVLIGAIEQAVFSRYLFPSPDQMRIISMVTNVTLACILGFSANYLYMKHTERKMAGFDNHASNKEEFTEILSKKGGTNLTVALGFLCMYIALILYAQTLLS